MPMSLTCLMVLVEAAPREIGFDPNQYQIHIPFELSLSMTILIILVIHAKIVNGTTSSSVVVHGCQCQ